MYANLKLQLWRSGIRQGHLAKSLDVDETVLSRIVNGFRKPGPELKARIAEILGSDPEWLFEETAFPLLGRHTSEAAVAHLKEEKKDC